MKKRLLLLCFLIIGTMNAFAQKAPVVFYGVDFSLVKVCGADESDTEFLFAFNKINDLFISEGQKYDVAKFMRLPITTKELAVAKRATKNAIPVSEDGNEHRLLYEDPNYDCLPQIETQIAGYELPQTEGRGAVIVANLLDKRDSRGSFYFVVFDIASRKVESCIPAAGKPGGFGLRNYWANALYQAMKAYYKYK